MTAPGLVLSGSARVDGAPLFGPVDFAAPAGRWTCLLGPSGVGKSTVLRLFAGLAGPVTLDGHAGASDGAPLAGRVALMAQQDLLLPWLDVLGNVLLGARLRGRRGDRAAARDILERVGLSAHAHKRPAALSGGQRQRAALARTLLEDRPVVLLDEPFSALDARTRAQMQDLSAALLARRTVLHVTHDPAEAARLGHHICLMAGDGIRPVPLSAEPPPRAFDAAATLSLQGALHRRLMQAA
ncbi:ATP-binding cassette domain-containing protein [Rhodobacteraceae bacterium 2CG4]|uniref:ATP-binding cassette domain-containing protein n=1 Tax=Halovulum marinum TaxID=2662447 RepID=A0A6L5YX43_9RHOB|nr:ABC transporter ATP-binding protein [Halovulum marinum]MSU88787.1 ATP-binding cassette domain-containing protein [Halovulum marinum]